MALGTDSPAESTSATTKTPCGPGAVRPRPQCGPEVAQHVSRTPAHCTRPRARRALPGRPARCHNARAMSRDLVREVAAEFLGTAVLIAFGVGVVAQVVLSAGANGSYLAINLGWGLAVTLGVLVAGGVSGAHLNPAVTVALAVHRGSAVGQGAVLRGRAGGRGVRRRGAGLCDLSRGHSPRSTAAPGSSLGEHGHRRHLRHLSAAVPVAGRRPGRSDRRHGAADDRRLRHRRHAQRRRRRAGWGRSWSGRSSSPSACRSASTPATPSTRPATSGRGSSRRVAGWGSGRVHRPANGWWWVPIVGPIVGAVLGGAGLRPVHHAAAAGGAGAMSRYVLALDQGTTSSRAMLFDRGGRVVSQRAAGVPRRSSRSPATSSTTPRTSGVRSSRPRARR